MVGANYTVGSTFDNVCEADDEYSQEMSSAEMYLCLPCVTPYDTTISSTTVNVADCCPHNSMDPVVKADHVRGTDQLS